jgi:EmrB/QacA subfamily drug resistance transporter
MSIVGTTLAGPPSASDGSTAATGGSLVRSLRSHFGLAVLLSILFLTFLDNTVISATLSSVQSQLHAGVVALEWVVSGYALTFASLMLLSGALGDLYGRKRILLIGIVIFCAGSVVCALSTTSVELIVGRIIMGIGAAGSEPGTLSMIRHIYPDRKQRARALGTWAAVSGLALAMGPVLGGALVGFWSWHAVFWFNLVFGGLVLVAGAVVLPESSDPSRGRLDVPGFILGAMALGTATFATIAGESAGYKTGWVLALYGVSILAVVAFILVEFRAENPMLDLSFFRRPPFAGSTFVAFTSYFAMFSVFFFVALYLEEVGSISSYTLALDFIPLLVGMVLSSLFAGRWVGASGSRTPMAIGCLVAAAGIILTNSNIRPDAGLAQIGWTMGIAGIGFGIIVVPVTSAALASVPPAHSGMAASTTNTARELGAVAGVAILGSVVNGQLTVHLTQRLAVLGIPKAFRSLVISAVTTGSIGSQARGSAGKGNASVQEIINKVVSAAYGAFGHGLHLALTASYSLLLLSAAVAWFTGTYNAAHPGGAGDERSRRSDRLWSGGIIDSEEQVERPRLVRVANDSPLPASLPGASP